MIEESLAYLGQRCRDKISEVTGIITSVSFDVSGCIQVCINRGLDKDGKLYENYWYDIGRIELLGDKVLIPPDFRSHSAPQHYDRGPAEKAPKP